MEDAQHARAADSGTEAWKQQDVFLWHRTNWKQVEICVGGGAFAGRDGVTETRRGGERRVSDRRLLAAHAAPPVPPSRTEARVMCLFCVLGWWMSEAMK